MKRLIIYSIFCLLSHGLMAQQDLSLHFMRDIVQSNNTNPAFFNKYKVNVSFLSSHLHLYNSAFSFNDVFNEEGNALILDMDQLISQLDETGNLLQGNFSEGTLAIGVQLKNLQFSLSHAVKAHAYFSYPKALPELLWNGNGSTLDQTLQIGPGINLMAYQEFGLGVAYRPNQLITFGGKIKYLSGIGTIYTERSKASVHTNPEYYQLTATTDYLIHSAGLPLEISSGDGEFISMGDFEPEFFNGNSGVSLDLGVTMQLSDLISISASILDVGQISWDTGSKNWESSGSFEYGGLDLQPLLEGDSLDFSSIMDTIEQVFQFEESQRGFSTTLPSRFYLSGTFQLKSLQLGALLYGESFQQKLYPAFALSARKEFGKIFSLGAVYSVRKNSFNNIGLNLALRLAGIQLYALTDNIVPIFNPLISRNANIRLGLNLAFGKKKKKQ